MSRFRSVVDRVIELSHESAARQDAVDEKHGVAELGVDLFAPGTARYMAASADTDRELRRYLKSLPEATVRKVETLMFFGRDSKDVHGNDIRWYHAHLARHADSKDDAVDAVCEIAGETTVKYLSQGLTKAGKLGIDIEAPFA